MEAALHAAAARVSAAGGTRLPVAQEFAVDVVPPSDRPAIVLRSLLREDEALVATPARLAPSFVVAASVAEVVRPGDTIQLRLRAVINVDGTLSPLAAEHARLTGLLVRDEVPEPELQAFRRLSTGDRLRVAVRAMPRGSTGTVRCSLRPDARHPSYTLSLACQPEEGLCVRQALRRLAFFHNPASTGLLAKHYKLQAQSTLLPPDIALASASAAESYRTLRRKQDVELSMQSTKAGVAHQRRGRFKEALACYARALQLKADNVETLVARGALYTKLEDYAAAERDLVQARKLNPEHANATLYLEITLLRRGMHKQARGKMVDAAEDFSAAAGLQGSKHEEALAKLRTLKEELDRRAARTHREQLAARATFGAGQASSAASGTPALVAAARARLLHDSDESDNDNGDRRRDEHRHSKKRHKHKKDKKVKSQKRSKRHSLE